MGLESLNGYARLLMGRVSNGFKPNNPYTHILKLLDASSGMIAIGLRLGEDPIRKEIEKENERRKE